MTQASENVYPKVIMAEGAAPSTPASGQVKLYAKADGLLYSKDDAGAETLVSGGAGGLTDHNHTSAGGDGGDLDAPVIDGHAIFNEEVAPSTPGAATVAVYAKSDGLMYSKDDAGVETLMSSGPAGAGGGILAVTQYTPGSDQVVHNTTNTTTGEDVSAANLSVTFTVPASGKVVVELCAFTAQASSGVGYWQIREGSTVIAEFRGISGTAYAETRPSVKALITGLTPSASVTYKFGHRVSGGNQDVYAGPLTGTYGPAIMIVYSAP